MNPSHALLIMTGLSASLILSDCSREMNPLDFVTFDKRAKSGDKLTVAFLGGSLTWGAKATDPTKTSYRALVSARLQETYPDAHFRFVDAAIGGTGSQLAAFRLERDVLAYSPDLVFLDFTVNDNAYAHPDEDRLASYESLVRRLVQAGIPVVQVILPSKTKDALPNPPERRLDVSHKEIGEVYGLPLADAVELLRKRVREGLVTSDQLWDAAPDITHPGDAGYALYADAVWDAYRQAVSDGVMCRLPEGMIHADTYMTVNRCRPAAWPQLPEGWKVGLPHRTALAFDFMCSRWMEELAVAGAAQDMEPDPLRFRLKAANLLLFGESTKESGGYRVKIDGVETGSYQTQCPSGNMRYVQMIATGLDPQRVHFVEIIPELQPGEELRIESICAAGGPAEVGPAADSQ